MPKVKKERKKLGMPWCLNGFKALTRLAMTYGKIRGGMVRTSSVSTHPIAVEMIKKEHPDMIADVARILQTSEEDTFLFLSRVYKGEERDIFRECET